MRCEAKSISWLAHPISNVWLKCHSFKIMPSLSIVSDKGANFHWYENRLDSGFPQATTWVFLTWHPTWHSNILVHSLRNGWNGNRLFGRWTLIALGCGSNLFIRSCTEMISFIRNDKQQVRIRHMHPLITLHVYETLFPKEEIKAPNECSTTKWLIVNSWVSTNVF